MFSFKIREILSGPLSRKLGLDGKHPHVCMVDVKLQLAAG